MRCVEIGIDEVCADLAQLLGLWTQVTGGGRYDIGLLGFSPLMQIISHRATIVHVTESDDPLEWIIQAFTSDFNSLANHSFVGQRFGDIPDDGYTGLIAPSLLATRVRGIPLAHFVDGMLDDQSVVYEKLTLPLYQDGVVEKLVTVSRET
ncbi:MAG: hypothetical protein QGG84_11185 [Rhodospirillales bacterium]|jgi:hypothetical protein|nr:hypothetical protein [Rhodospirillales bacterium]